MTSLRDKKLFLLDMDGTVYLDQVLFEDTIPFLEAIRRQGGRYLFLTNNSSLSTTCYVEKLKGMGVDVQDKDFLTSTTALIQELQGENSYKRCYAFGTESFRSQLRQAGIAITDTLQDDVDCLVIGFDTELTFQKLEDACILLERGVDYLATNPDWVCPTWYGAVPDCGSVCEMLFRATGRSPRVIGKPQPAMPLLAMEKYGASREETVMIGDRLYTDVASGAAAGIDTVFVLSGEGKQEDLVSSSVQPTWVMGGIGDIVKEMEREGSR